MKVAVYLPGLAPERGGGYTYEREIGDALVAARGSTRHEIVAAGPEAVPPDGWSASTYVSLHRNRVARLAGKVARAMAEVPRVGRPPRWPAMALWSHGVDLLWCSAPGAPTYLLPFVATIWDLQHRLQPIFPELTGREWLARERFVSREIGQAAIVIVGTAAGQAEVERFYGVPPTRIRRLPHPTPGFALNPPVSRDDEVLARYRLEPGYVLYPAQFWAHKNHVAVLRALHLLRKAHGLELRAVFVGSDKGNEAHVRRTASDLGLDAQVRFLGFVPQPDLVSLYRQAFALTYLSFFGPENLPPLEAFALGCPVVASSVPGSEEQLGDAALLAPPTSESQIADALLALHHDRALRQRLIERGRSRACAFTSAHFVEGMFEIMDELELVVRAWR